VVNRSSPPPRTMRLNSLFGRSTPHTPSSPHIVKSTNSGFMHLSSYWEIGNEITGDARGFIPSAASF
jgi:hypothetical protein